MNATLMSIFFSLGLDKECNMNVINYHNTSQLSRKNAITIYTTKCVGITIYMTNDGKMDESTYGCMHVLASGKSNMQSWSGWCDGDRVCGCEMCKPNKIWVVEP